MLISTTRCHHIGLQAIQRLVVVLIHEVVQRVELEVTHELERLVLEVRHEVVVLEVEPLKQDQEQRPEQILKMEVEASILAQKVNLELEPLILVVVLIHEVVQRLELEVTPELERLALEVRYEVGTLEVEPLKQAQGRRHEQALRMSLWQNI
jgi:hypothetical protein